MADLQWQWFRNRDGVTDITWHNFVTGEVCRWRSTAAAGWPVRTNSTGDAPRAIARGLVAAWLLNGGTIVAGSGLLTEWCGVSDGCVFQAPIGISH